MKYTYKEITMTGVKTRIEALDLTRKYASIIRAEIDAKALVYLFGSYARDAAGVDSDIDIAVVSKRFGKNVVEDFGKVNILRHSVSLDIEAHPFTFKEWNSPTSFIETIQDEGISV
jgi:predicted nucleotidyltransferase